MDNDQLYSVIESTFDEFMHQEGARHRGWDFADRLVRDLAANGWHIEQDDPRHIIDLRVDGWTIKHPLSCRPNLFACTVNQAAGPHFPAPPPQLGQFACTVHDGKLVIGERVA